MNSIESAMKLVEIGWKQGVEYSLNHLYEGLVMRIHTSLVYKQSENEIRGSIQIGGERGNAVLVGDTATNSAFQFERVTVQVKENGRVVEKDVKRITETFAFNPERLDDEHRDDIILQLINSSVRLFQEKNGLL